MTFTWKHVLYRFYAEDGALLYVGITQSISIRFRQHADKPWWPEVVDCRIAFYPERASLERAEHDAIRYERPRYNIRQGNPRPVISTVPRRPSAALPPRERRVPRLYPDGSKVPLRKRVSADEWAWINGVGVA